MIQFLEFTFDSFWHFVGILVLIVASSGAITRFLSALVMRNGWKVIEPQFRKAIRDAILEARAHE